MALERVFKGMLLGALCLQVSLSGGIPSRIPKSCSHSADACIQAKVAPEKLLESYFVSKGFSTGNIKIPELDVELTLKKNQFYKKEEKVTDVFKRINEIRSQFGLSIPYPDYADGYGWCGVLYAECSGKKGFGYIVLVKKDLNEASKIYTSGHEYGHFLWYIGKKELIYQKFKKSDFVKSHVQKNEDFALLCGWMAMKKAGYVLDDCIIINSNNPEKEKKSDRMKNVVRDYLRDN